MNFFWDLFLGGITRGSIYALIALGYTMVYGILELINFAHGEIYMIGAFTALIAASILTMQGLTGISVLLLAMLIAVLYSSAYGYSVEKIAYKPLRRAPRLSPLISAIGMSIFLQNYVMLAQTSDFLPFPDLLMDVELPEAIAEWIAPSEFMIVVSAAVLMICLTLVLKFTKMGKAMRAVAQDREMAMLLGINVNRIISQTFIIGSALAAIGGVLIGSHVGRINFYIGFAAGIKAFTAAVLGGIGSIPGAMLGGLVLGLTESFATGYVSSDYENVFAFALLVLILIFKPEGLLGRSSQQKV
ncbi:MAG TPA: branched-chain amino acid ABC transporter permease LivH [Smithellaceae bacterium]|jgi:branched-chain amino acid transport system permease protein|nr:branched-chain amino acid ABC transporter permease LivH [Smithellaceae bacterium]